MEIFNLLETIEDMLENSKTLPFTSKAVLDKDELLDNFDLEKQTEKFKRMVDSET